MSERSRNRHIILISALILFAAVLMAATPQQKAAKPSDTAIPGGILKITASLSPASAKVGDTVTIIEHRPMSARKRWHLSKIVEKAV